jgi:hypothetical protein
MFHTQWELTLMLYFHTKIYAHSSNRSNISLGVTDRQRNKLHPSTKTELARSHRKDARYENGKGNILLETHFKETNRKTKDMLRG